MYLINVHFHFAQLYQIRADNKTSLLFFVLPKFSMLAIWTYHVERSVLKTIPLPGRFPAASGQFVCFR